VKKRKKNKNLFDMPLVGVTRGIVLVLPLKLVFSIIPHVSLAFSPELLSLDDPGALDMRRL
jgi:hypothetical protein